MIKAIQLILSFLTGILATILFLQVNPESAEPVLGIPATPTQAPMPGTTGTEVPTVAKVVDGDTIVLSNGKHLRYIGVDTPETVDPRRPVGCFGKEAAAENSKLVLGKSVTLEKDISETDKYGRLLRYVYVDGVMVNEELVRLGYAFAVSYPPDVKYQARFREAEQLAQASRSGLWSNCLITPTP